MLDLAAPSVQQALSPWYPLQACGIFSAVLMSDIKVLLHYLCIRPGKDVANNKRVKTKRKRSYEYYVGIIIYPLCSASSFSARKVGQRVGIGWHGGHCCHCRACRNGELGTCENALVTGLSIDAAPLLCAGRTTFGAIKSSNLKGSDLVAIHGTAFLSHYS